MFQLSLSQSNKINHPSDASHMAHAYKSSVQMFKQSIASHSNITRKQISHKLMKATLTTGCRLPVIDFSEMSVCKKRLNLTVLNGQ